MEEKNLILLDEDRTILALMQVEDVYSPNVRAECLAVWGTYDDNHPFIQSVLSRGDQWYVSGPLKFEKEFLCLWNACLLRSCAKKYKTSN